MKVIVIYFIEIGNSEERFWKDHYYLPMKPMNAYLLHNTIQNTLDQTHKCKLGKYRKQDNEPCNKPSNRLQQKGLV